MDDVVTEPPDRVLRVEIISGVLLLRTYVVGDQSVHARSQIGVPYQWGGDGEGAGDTGFDCSGLIKAAYATAGIHLPRTAQTQFSTGPILPANAVLQPGDLVFFGTGPGHIDHVGIYFGDIQMIDAPHHGSVVRLDPVWARRVGATRPGSADQPISIPYEQLHARRPSLTATTT